MVFFGRKNKAEQKTTQKKARSARSADADPAALQNRDLSNVLVRPRITEKSASQNERGVYTFLVRRDATKYDVRDAVEMLFKVTPRKITIVHTAPRKTHSRTRGRTVTQPGMKKANVFLKKGDTIDLS